MRCFGVFEKRSQVIGVIAVIPPDGTTVAQTVS